MLLSANEPHRKNFAHSSPRISYLKAYRYHDPPVPLAEGASPEVRLVDATQSSDGQHTIHFICYDCTEWAGAGVNVDSDSQYWAWASNFWQRPSSDTARPLSKHMDDGELEGVLHNARKVS